MKKLIYMRAAFIVVYAIVSALLLPACPSSSDGTHGSGNTSEPPTEIQYGNVVFNNRDGICSVRVYNSAAERNEAGECIVEVAAGDRSEEKVYQATEYGFTFYFSYIYIIDDVPLSYIPQQPDGIQTIHINSGTEPTEVVIPPIDAVVQSTAPLTGSVYIKIKNDSAFSLSLVKGVNVMKPENYEVAGSVSSYIVNGGQIAIYKLNFYEGETENAQIYKLNIINGSTLYLHTIVPELQAGYIYNIVVNNQNLAALAPELDSYKPITMAEVAAESAIPNEQRENKTFSFTKWRDVKKDPATGEYLKDPETGKDIPGDNTIDFSGKTARLSGSYWSQVGGHNYSGQILESEYKANLNAMVIWTQKAENRGFRLEALPGDVLHITPSTTRNPFYKQ